jgi:hypothetical protein
MRYLSWDVGVKNMAYALLEKDGETCKLLRTGILNLIDKRECCSYMLRTKKECGKIARQKVLNDMMEEVKLCKAHCTKIKVESYKSSDYKCAKCGSVSSVNILGKDEWSWCEKHENLSKKVLTQFKAKKITGQNCSQQPLQELISELVKKLDENPDFLDIEGVWIENQPALINPAIKTIASALYTYFVVRGIIDKTENKLTFVKFASPLNKLKVAKKTTSDALKNAKSDREYYNIEKGLAIIYVKTLLTKDELILMETAIENNNNKGDDFCDAYLQGFHHIFDGVIPEHYQEKLRTIPEDQLTTKKIKSKKRAVKVETETEIEGPVIEDKKSKSRKRIKVSTQPV